MPFWSTLHPTELTLTLNELRGTLKNIIFSAPHPALHSFAKLILCRGTQRKFQFFEKSASAVTVQLSYCHIYHIMSKVMKYNVPYHFHCSFADPSDEINDLQRNPREISQFGIKSAKVYHCLHTVVQQSNCRWHCERSCFSSLAKTRKVSSHPPSPISPFPMSPSLSLPLQTLRLVSLVSLITKT